MPTASAAMDILPPGNTLIVSQNPSPTFPRTFSSERNISSKTTSAVSDALMPSLSSFFPGRRPSVPFSAMKVVIPLFPFPLSVDASKTYMSPFKPWVINIFAPFTRHPPSTFSAFDFIDAASEPESGSVRHQAPSFSPVASAGRYFFFCASFPDWRM